jgi:hypothetical protein
MSPSGVRTILDSLQAYERALRELVATDPNDDLRYHRLLDAPPEEAERGTAQWLAIEYSVLRDLINGRPDLTDGELYAFCRDLNEWTNTILERLRRADRLEELRSMPYRAYLRTPEWQDRREAALVRARWRCQLCNANDVRLDVHHRSYERRGEERDDDLTVLCAWCHSHFHEHRDLTI